MNYLCAHILFLFLINSLFFLKGAEQPFAFSSYIPVPARQTASNLLSYASNIISTSVESAFETARNTISDDAALEKLEWPPICQKAREEAKRNSEIYQLIREQNYMTVPPIEIFSFIERRRSYLLRAIQLLPTHPDGLFIAKHCLEKHAIVMDLFLKNHFLAFINKTKHDSEKVSNSVNQLLEK